MKDKSLSTYAHNVKIITQNGVVTLKGPVRSEEEKQAVEAKAKEIAGPGKVTSDLEVKPKRQNFAIALRKLLLRAKNGLPTLWKRARKCIAPSSREHRDAILYRG